MCIAIWYQTILASKLMKNSPLSQSPFDTPRRTMPCHAMPCMQCVRNEKIEKRNAKNQCKYSRLVIQQRLCFQKSILHQNENLCGLKEGREGNIKILHAHGACLSHLCWSTEKPKRYSRTTKVFDLEESK
jgi:hypothetical protein